MELQDFYKINKHTSSLTSSLTCSKCGDKFECNPNGECWCKVLKHKIQKEKIDNTNPTCLCKNCLNETCSNSNLQYFFNFE